MPISKNLKTIELVLEKYINQPISHNTNAPSPLGMTNSLPAAATAALSSSKSLIEEDLSSQLADDLRAFINSCADDDETNLSYATKLLSQVVSKTKPPNDYLIHIVDEELLVKILGSINSASSTETINAVLRLMTFLIRGWVFSKNMDKERYLVPVLNALTETGYKLLQIISTKVEVSGNVAVHIENNLELVLKSINFITSFLSINHLKMGSLTNLMEFILNLQKNEFLLFLINVYRIDESRFQKYVHQPMLQLRETLITNFNMLNIIFVKDYLGINLVEKLVQEIIDDLTRSNNLINAKESSIFIKENFSLLQLTDLYFFLKNTNISFKKQFYEQLIFHTSESDQDEIFPLVVASSKITNVILEIPGNEDLTGLFKVFILKDMVYYHLLVKMSEVWNASKAILPDLYKMCSIVDIVLALINEDVSKILELGTFTVDKLVSIFKKITYEDIRSVQLKQIKDAHLNSLSAHTIDFDILLKEQVFEFIKNQRIINLSKGCWVYSSISTSVDDNHDSSAFKYYFVILSANHKQLLYQEYPTKLDKNPNIDKSGEAINISSINKIQTQLVLQSSKDKTITHNMDPNSRLVNLLERPTINKVTLLNRKGNALLTVYDTVGDSSLWIDGLKLLMKDFDSISDELRKQSLELFEVRKGIQLISLENKVIHHHNQEHSTVEVEEVGDSDLEDGFYDLEELQDIAVGFYYT